MGLSIHPEGQGGVKAAKAGEENSGKGERGTGNGNSKGVRYQGSGLDSADIFCPPVRRSAVTALSALTALPLRRVLVLVACPFVVHPFHGTHRIHGSHRIT